MLTITTSSLSDTLPSSVPKLDAEGDNWAIFLVRFMDAVEAKGFWGHFDGSSPAPVTTIDLSDAEKAAKIQWDKDERSAKTLLTQKLPDSTVMEIHAKKTVKERWEAVVKEYTVKGTYAQTEMRAKFLTSRCPEKGNAREFLRGLRLKKEELAQVGVKISDEDYLSTIISSLPDGLSNFASMQMSWTLQQSQQSMDASTLMTMLLQEAERQDLRTQKRKQSMGKSKEGEKDEALVVSAEKPRGKRDLSKIECWNCGELGHFSSECDKPKKSGDTRSTVKSDSKKEGTSAAAVNSSSDDEEAWAAEEIRSDDLDWFEEAIAAVDNVSCDEVLDWFEEAVIAVDVASRELTPLDSGCGNDLEEEVVSLDAVEEMVEDLFVASGEAFVVAEPMQSAGMAELYNSSRMDHVSPDIPRKLMKEKVVCGIRVEEEEVIVNTNTDLPVDVEPGPPVLEKTAPDDPETDAPDNCDAETLEPCSLAEAQKQPNHDWPLLEEEELATLKVAGTWNAVDWPVGVNVVGSKWMFKAKDDAAGNVVCYKACLAAQDFSKAPGVDCFDTFAAVARLASIRTVLTFAAAEDYEIGQIDIEGTCSNGELTEDEVAFMKQVPGYEPDLEEVKQAGRWWYQLLVMIMNRLDFNSEKCGGDQVVSYRRCDRMSLKGLIIVSVVDRDDCRDCSIASVGKTKVLIARSRVVLRRSVGTWIPRGYG
jgi:reverse transcriptase-like protein/LTR polyprotein gag-polypeptide-like protein/zinc knuckle protein